MARNTDNSPMTIEQARAKLAEKMNGTVYEVPEWGVVRVSMLKSLEIQAINKATRRDDGLIEDAWLWNCLSAATGLVEPEMTPEQIGEYPPEYVMPIANEVWRLTNAYTDRNAKERDAPVNPSRRRSSSSIGSLTDSGGSLEK